MNSALYKQFTPEERLRLAVVAQARGDFTEVVRLWESCPEMTLVGHDPKFCRRVHRTREAVSAVISSWLEASHYVICDCLLVTALPLESECELQNFRVKGSGDEELANLHADYATLAATAEASWKAYTAIWKGIESGVTRFCTEVEITRDQLLAMGEWLPAAIERARGLLDPDSRVYRACEEATYRRLHNAWGDRDAE